MKRRNFILSSLTAAPIVASGNTLFNNPERQAKSFVVKKGEARFGVHTPFKGVNPNDLKISKKDTEGSVAMFEYIGIEKTALRCISTLSKMKFFMLQRANIYFK